MLYHQARSEVERLVERFSKLSERNRRTYNEPATRQAFILPLFRALGWNTDDIREVSPEEKVSRGSVDFAFKLRGIPRFFLETKKIQADLEDPKWAFQAINYAWNKGVTWAVLSDFEGLKIFNAEWLEKIPARAIFKDLNWQEYLDRFDDLWLLSRPAMEEGLLDKEAEKVGRRTKKAPVTRQLFADLTEWRRELFRHLRPYNPDLSIEQIDQAVQRILDRLIFIRTCEDRELEERRLLPLLRQFQEGSRRVDLLKELKRLFREFDETYNARLFAPHFCENLASEPAPFERIINELYDVPDTYATYDFSAIDADVLGAIYEQYLGYRVQDPEGKQVVDKRAKRKAQGIYYTPQFVVRYIVRETLGRFLEENDYERARDVRVLDMACGSGSFLIEAFDALDKYFSEKNAPRAEPRDEAQHPASPAGDFHDYARRMEILSKNLYGVDLDAQAVEIAQLNLLLKALNQKGRLPELENIRQGNSLISGTEEELRKYFGESWQDKRPFNWEEEFPEAMERGGFDVIVGNPPWGGDIDADINYFHAKYPASTQEHTDSFKLFIERALSLARPGGLISMIVPNTLLRQRRMMDVRKLLLENRLRLLVDLGENVFPDVVAPSCIFVVEKGASPSNISILDVSHLQTNEEKAESLKVPLKPLIVKQSRFLSNADLEFAVPMTWESAKIIPLGQCDFLICEDAGINYQRVGVGMREKGRSDLGKRLLYEGAMGNPEDKMYWKGTDINRYWIAESTRRFCRTNYKQFIRDNEVVRLNVEVYSTVPKILIRQTADRVIATIDYRGVWFGRSILSMLSSPGTPYRLEYFLALLNSRLFVKLYQDIVREKGRVFAQVKLSKLKQLPIRLIDFSDPADAARHDKMVAMVEEMLRLQKEREEAEALKDDRRHELARRIERLDKEIDALVYELYGLTEEEIAVVEGSKG